VLLDRDTGLCSGRISVPVGEWGKIRFLSGCLGGWSKTFPAVQGDSVDHQEHLRENHGRGEHYGVGCAGRNGQEPSRLRPHLGGIRVNIRFGTHAH